MLKKRVPVPRAHAPTAVSARPRPSDLRAMIVRRVPLPVAAPPMETVQPVQHAPTVSVPPPASAPRARTMTAPLPQSDPLAVSALTANVPLMATVRHVVNGLTASAHRVPAGLIPIALVQTASDLTGPLPIVHPLTAEVVTSVPLASDPVVPRARLMTAPATAIVLRAR